MELLFLKTISEQYDTMTKTFRKIADYLKHDYVQLPFYSIQEVAQQAKVSPASVHRFCTSLGYTGFTSLQREIQVFLQKDIMENETEEYKHWKESEAGILQNQIDSNIQVLQEMMTEDLSISFEKTVNEIRKARRVYILGLRASYGVAYLFYHLLSESMDNVTILSLGADDIYDRISSVQPEDLLFTIGFKPYDQYTVNIAKNFHSLNAKIITLTDKANSPLAANADIALLPGNHTPSYGFVMAVTILKALGMAVNNLKEPEMLEYYERKKEFLFNNDILI